MTLFGSFVAIALEAALAYILVQIYNEVTKRLGVPNGIGIAVNVTVEIIGGWILGIMLCMERGMDYGERLCR